MRNPHGTPVWYELMTRDPQGARRFYAEVVGWKIDEAAAPGATVDYRMIAAADVLVGGVFTLTAQHLGEGAQPGWMLYLGVDDVDGCVASVQAAGGRVLLPAFEVPNVGRIAMLSDPQGAMVYVMRGLIDQASTSCAPELAGHGAWHELHTSDVARATAFYLAQFGWGRSRAVDVGPAGVYQLFSVGGRDVGGIMNDARGARPHWMIYFRVDGIEAAAGRVAAAGGQVVLPPMEVPGGGWVLNAMDPDGALFALTGRR